MQAIENRDAAVQQLSEGARFTLLGELEDILSAATKETTIHGPLRHKAVETFDEKNTGANTGSMISWLDWEIDPNGDGCTIDVYLAGGDRTLPGAAKALMPGESYECVSEFVASLVHQAGTSASGCRACSGAAYTIGCFIRGR